MIHDEVLAGLSAAIQERIEAKDERAEALSALDEQLDKLGFFGLLAVLSDAPEPDETTHAEPIDAIRRRLAEGLAPEGVTPPEDMSELPELEALLARYVEEKGASVARRAVENAIFDLYDLSEHGLFVDDVSKGTDLWRATRAPGDDVKDLIRKLARLSSETAKFVLGLFPEQINLIYRINQRVAEPHEIERAFDDFGPPAIRKRLMAVTQTLLERDKRFRLAANLWCRTRGVPISRESLLGIRDHLEIKAYDKVIARALERADFANALIAFIDAHPAIAALEAQV